MTLFLLLESLKFYKIRHEKTVQVWFVLLYALNVLVFLLPIGDRDFESLFSSMDEMMNGQMPSLPLGEILSAGNYVVLGISLAASILTTFFGWMYAVLLAGETDKVKPGDAFRSCLRALPSIIIFAILLIVPAILSAMLAFIPLLIFLLMMYFLPMNLALGKMSLLEAMRASYESTSHSKLRIFIQVMLLSFVLSLPQDLLLNFAPNGGLPYMIIISFFIVLRAFVFGRLMGLMYLYLVKKVPIVIRKNDKQN